MSDYDVDLFVIGGGSGGVRAARIAAQHGARVMLAEEYRVGGTCVIRGCVPKKLLVYASRFRAEFEDAAGYGWTVPQASFDWPTLDRQQGPRDRAARSGLYRDAGEGRRHHRQKPRRAHGRPHGAIGERRSGARGLYPDRHRRRAEPWRSYPRHRARHLLERGVPPAAAAAAGGDPGRRLHRRGVRRHLCRARRPGDADLSRREHFARLRRRRAGASCAWIWRSTASGSSPAAKSRPSSEPAPASRCICRAAISSVPIA